MKCMYTTSRDRVGRGGGSRMKNTGGGKVGKGGDTWAEYYAGADTEGREHFSMFDVTGKSAQRDS